MRFSSDRAKKKDNIYTLNGNVSLVQDNMTLKAETASLYYSKSNPDNMKLEKAVAKGHVQIKKTFTDSSAELRASCHEMTFFPEKKLLILTGNAKIWRDDEFVHAKTIEMDTETGNLKFNAPRGKFAAPKPK